MDMIARIFQLKEKYNCENVMLSESVTVDNDFYICRKLSDAEII